MSEITIDQNIDNIQTKLNNLTEGGGDGSQEVITEKGLLANDSSSNINKEDKSTLLNSLLNFPNIVGLLLPVLFISLLLILKPGFVMYTPDNNKPEDKKLSIQKCLLFGGVTGVVLGSALIFYFTTMKTKKD